MGGVQRGRDARDLLDSGASVVAVGTESFRDPLAGARIADELRSFPANSEVPVPDAEEAGRAPI
jgi:dihydroorotate dehydrogenase